MFVRAERMGLQPAWLVPGSLFVIATVTGEKYINYASSTLNSHNSVRLAKNKYHTRVIIGRHGLPNIPYARSNNLSEVLTFLATHGKIIAKPLCGSGSQDVHIVSNASQLATLDIEKYIFEKYILGTEMRYLVLNGDVIAVYQSEYGMSVEVTRPLQCISHPPASWNSQLMTISLEVARIFSLQFAAVDYMIDTSGHAYILEVNTMPDLKWFHAPSKGPSVDVAQLFLAAMVSDLQTT